MVDLFIQLQETIDMVVTYKNADIEQYYDSVIPEPKQGLTLAQSIGIARANLGPQETQEQLEELA